MRHFAPSVGAGASPNYWQWRQQLPIEGRSDARVFYEDGDRSYNFSMAILGTDLEE
jgi:hypothetical protein